MLVALMPFTAAGRLPTTPGFASFLLYPVVLSAPDTVLIERNLGKRIDPQTGGTAVSTFPQPPRGVSQGILVTALPTPH